jgi:DNA-binding MarR family transcriptional regulator
VLGVAALLPGVQLVDAPRFVYLTKVNGRAPAEADMQRYFGTTPPSVHPMVLTLERNGLITRTPGAARSLRLLLDRAALPDLK